MCEQSIWRSPLRQDSPMVAVTDPAMPCPCVPVITISVCPHWTRSCKHLL